MATEHASYDSIWKALPPAVLLGLLRTIFPDIGDTIQQVPTELRLLPERQIDGAFLVSYHGILVLIHLEYQQRNDTTMPFRMYQYDAMLKIKYAQEHNREDIPILSIVIWAIPKSEQTPEPVYRNKIGDLALGVWPYSEIHLSRIDWNNTDPLYMALAPLAVDLGRDELKDIGFSIAENAPGEIKAILIAAFLQLAVWKLTDIKDIEQAILMKAGMTMADLYEAVEKSNIGIGILTKGRAEGEVKGEAKGRLETLEALIPDVSDASEQQKQALLAKLEVLSVEKYKVLIRTLRTRSQATFAEIESMLSE